MNGRNIIDQLLSNWPVKILSVAAAVVLFLFYRISSLEERYFSVPLALEVAEGFVATESNIGSVRINIRGAEDEIFSILEDDINAYIDLTAHGSEGQFRAPVLLRKTGSAETAEVEATVDPLTATVTLEQQVSVELAVNPNLSGFPALGYELSEYAISPSVIEVIGPKSRIEGILELQTEAIDLTGRNEDFTLRTTIDLERDLVELVGSNLVEFSGRIQERIISRTFEVVDITPEGLKDSLVIIGGPPTGSMRVSGPQLVLENIDRRTVRLVIDCSVFEEPGSYEIPTLPVVPRRLTVSGYQPEIVTLILAPQTLEEEVVE